MDKEYYGVTITKINPKDTQQAANLARALTNNIREDDKKEIEDAGLKILPSVYDSIISSTIVYKAEQGNTLLCLFGVREEKEDAVIWALGTQDLIKHKRTIVTAGLDFVRECKQKYRWLYNFISLDNKRALRFIRKAGAVLCSPTIINGNPFFKFLIKGDNNV